MTEHQRYQESYNALLVNKRLLYAGLLLERAARLWPEHRAVICQDQQVTYKELFHRSLRVSAALLKAGITEDSRVMLLYENSINFYVAYYAGYGKLAELLLRSTPCSTQKNSLSLLPMRARRGLLFLASWRTRSPNMSTLFPPFLPNQTLIPFNNMLMFLMLSSFRAALMLCALSGMHREQQARRRA